MPTLTEKLQQIQSLLTEWTNKQGHDSCWYYPDIFREITQVLGVEIKTPDLPSREEFVRGCRKFQLEQYPPAELHESVEQFPVEETIEIDENIFIHCRPFGESEPYQLWLKVDNQYFAVNDPTADEEHVRWHALMLQKALNKIRITKSL